jgi:hypothetical protein
MRAPNDSWQSQTLQKGCAWWVMRTLWTCPVSLVRSELRRNRRLMAHYDALAMVAVRFAKLALPDA